MWNKLFGNRQNDNAKANGIWTSQNDSSLIELRSVEKAYDTAAGEFLALKHGPDRRSRRVCCRRRQVGQRQVDVEQHDHRHRPAHKR